MSPQEQVQQFLSHLHRGGAYAYTWHLNQRTRKGGLSAWESVGTPLKIAPKAVDLYFGIHPTNSIPSHNVKGEAVAPAAVRSHISTIAAINCLFAEFDAKDFDNDYAAMDAALDAVPLAPSVVVASGGGVHAYWLIDRPFVVTDENRDEVRDIQYRWVAFTGSDGGSKDLARVLRVPGTKNGKYKPLRPVEFVRFDMELVYDLGELVSLMPPPAAPEVVQDTLPVHEPRKYEARQSLPSYTIAMTVEDRVAAALDRISSSRANEYNQWIGVGAALKGSDVSGGLSVWDAWSRSSSKHQAGCCASKWHELPADQDGLVTLEKMANLDSPPVKHVAPPLIIENDIAYCPQCERKVGKSKFGGWFCGCTKPSLRWPDSAYTPAAGAPAAPAGAPAAAGRKTVQRPPRKAVHASKIGSAVGKITWLIPGVLAYDAITQIFAPPGSGKSLLVLDQSLSVAQEAPVVYVVAEAAGEQEERIIAWCEHHNRDAGNLFFWPWPVMLKNAAEVDEFIAEMQEIKPALIVLDPLASCMVGLEESSTGDMAIAVDTLNRIRTATGAAINVVHHTGWSDTHERGSSVLRAACRVVMKLITNDSGLMTLTCEKANNGKPFEARYFRLVERAESVVPIPASKVSAQGDKQVSLKQIEILEAMNLAQHREGASFTQILDTTGQAKSTLNYSIGVLLDRKYIEKDKHVFVLTEKGKAELVKASSTTEVASDVYGHSNAAYGNWVVTVADAVPVSVDGATYEEEPVEVVVEDVVAIEEPVEEVATADEPVATAREGLPSKDYAIVQEKAPRTRFWATNGNGWGDYFPDYAAAVIACWDHFEEA